MENQAFLHPLDLNKFMALSHLQGVNWIFRLSC